MKNNNSDILMILAILFCTALIVSNIIAGKLILLPYGIILPAAVVLFPIVYILGDVIPEIYGLQIARRIIWYGFGANLFAVLFFLLTLLFVSPPFFKNQTAFQVVLGFTPRLLFASFVAYLVGTNANAYIMVKVKKLTKSRFLWIRTISSTIIGEGLDSLIFISITFFGIVPLVTLISLIMTQATFKILYEVIATPLTYLIIHHPPKPNISPSSKQESISFIQ